MYPRQTLCIITAGAIFSCEKAARIDENGQVNRMRREYNRYSGYRGRSTTTDKLRVIAITLFVLVLLAIAALLIGQRYIVYTDDGIRLELPFLEREEPKQPPEDLENIEVVVEPLEPEEETPAETPPEEEEVLWLKAVALPLEAVLEGTAADQARQLGANAIVLDMKTDLGQLGYRSQLPLAEQFGVNSADSEINGKLGELSGGEFYLIARISCFRDHALAEELAYAIETNPGRRWFDFDSVRWSSPASPAVQEYLTGIMTELAQLGFDEILLDRWGYPTRADGHLEYIKKGDAYQVGELDQTIKAFLQKAKEALADSGTMLAVQVDDKILSGDGLESGQTLELALAASQRIWLEGTADLSHVMQQVEAAGLENPGQRLVTSVEALELEQEENQWLKAAEG